MGLFGQKKTSPKPLSSDELELIAGWYFQNWPDWNDEFHALKPISKLQFPKEIISLAIKDEYLKYNPGEITWNEFSAFEHEFVDLANFVENELIAEYSCIKELCTKEVFDGSFPTTAMYLLGMTGVMSLAIDYNHVLGQLERAANWKNAEVRPGELTMEQIERRRRTGGRLFEIASERIARSVEWQIFTIEHNRNYYLDEKS